MRAWTSLVELVKAETLHPLTTSITVREVEARLSDALGEAEAAAQKHASMFSQLDSGAPLGQGDRDSRRSALNDRFKGFIQEARFEDVPIDASVGDVMEDYFACRPPFGAGKKKSEFPEAFVLTSLVA